MPRRDSPPVSRRFCGPRLWLMRLTAAVLMPALTLGGLEVVLRLAGTGHSTRYWVASEIDGTHYFVPNTTFTYLFFPPALSRAPLPKRILAEKPEGTYRIFLFGESAAYGDPEPAYGVGRQLEVLLRERYAGTAFEVVCTAMTAINSHAILPIARESAKLDGDLWILYMGNNEMVGAYGAGTVFSSKAPPRWIVRAVLAVKATRVGQLLETLAGRVRGDPAVPEEWAGIDMFSENHLRHNDPARLTTYRNFRGNLRDILKTAERADVPVLVSTVAANLRDCAPFASLHSEDLGTRQLGRWRLFFEQGNALENAGSFEAALNAYAGAAAIDPHFAELQFRIGRARLALQKREAAREALERARDNDALAVRADTRINRILRDESRKAGGRVLFLDAAAELAADLPDGLPGREFFYEHVHLTLAGNYRLARLLAEKVAMALPPGITETGKDQWVTAEDCERALAITLWDQHRLWNNMHARLRVPPFTRQSSHQADLAYLRSEAEAVIARIGPQTPQADRRLYEEAITKAPGDYMTRALFGQYLEAMGARTEAIAEFQRVCELLPDLEWPHYYLGKLLLRAGRDREAARSFTRALEIRSDFRQARAALASIEERSR